MYIFVQDYVDIPYAGDIKSVSGDTDIGDDVASVDTGFYSDLSRSTARFVSTFYFLPPHTVVRGGDVSPVAIFVPSASEVAPLQTILSRPRHLMFCTF